MFMGAVYLVLPWKEEPKVVVVIDYNMGNLGSILNMLRKVNAEAICSLAGEVIDEADKLILPGVGAFDVGMNNLTQLGLITVLNRKVIDEKTPILGICLGMQLFTKRSEEGKLPGLGWIDAKTVRFNSSSMRIPHMGWNTIEVKQRNYLFDGLSEPRFYFVHSYHVQCTNEENILSTTYYGHEFISSVVKENIIGVQFHPEKSHKFGIKLMENFVNHV